tara:strand:+ start:1363 stop:1665 length:303 start_codon:yes stop_codon:yes gene_type:complete
MIRILIVLLFASIIGGCSESYNVVPRAFGKGPSSQEICNKQGISENNEQYNACIAFYELQNNNNRRNILLAGTIAVLGGIMFENNCECFFGPDRGVKFRR